MDVNVLLARPLLDLTKDQLLTIAKGERIPFREDATNAQTDFLRNRVRLEVIPLLSKIQPAAKITILRTMEIVRAESELVLNEALQWLGAKKRPSFQNLPVSVQRLCLRMQLRTLVSTVDFDLIEQLRQFPDRAVSVASGVAVERSTSGTVHLCKEVAGFAKESQEVNLVDRKSIQFGGHPISWKFQSKAGESFRRETGCEVFDADKVGKKVRLRHWRPGDRFQPVGMNKPVKLQDLFVNQKVPREQRHAVIVAETEGGELFWVQGFRISDRFKLTAGTKCHLRWYF